MSDERNLPAVLSRITEYLDSGGLWNPELADHAAVRDLILDARDEINRLHCILATLREPSKAVLYAAHDGFVERPAYIIRKAVEAAEQEVGP